jgi:hypothetical protein
LARTALAWITAATLASATAFAPAATAFTAPAFPLATTTTSLGRRAGIRLLRRILRRQGHRDETNAADGQNPEQESTTIHNASIEPRIYLKTPVQAVKFQW